MEIIVPDDQLSLAIGRKGQNVRLAAQLTGWNIDILSETKHDETTRRAKQALVVDLGIEDSLSSIFYSHTFRSTADIAESSVEEFLTIPGINPDRLREIHQRAVDVMAMPVGERPSEIWMREEAQRIAREKAENEAKAKAEAEAAQAAAAEAKAAAEAAEAEAKAAAEVSEAGAEADSSETGTDSNEA